MRRHLRALLCLLLATPALAADKSDEWTEVRSPNFIVISSAGEKHGRNIAEQFELFRAVFAQLFPNARVDLGKPLIIFAVKNEKGLRELLPAYWEKKGRAQPAGMFIQGPEKLYVALRTDVQGEYPYQIIYHEYAHALMRLNIEDLPLWLSEGLAEFYAQAYLGNREASLGRPSEYHLYNLRQQKLMSLEELLSADHTSPAYNEENKASVFYSQAWALTHFLMFDKNAREAQWLSHYLGKARAGVPPMEAAKQVFGDLKLFARKFDNYLRQSVFLGLKTRPDTKFDERTFPARLLNPAESAAVRGDFHVHMNRREEALALLNEALKLDPKNAQAHESMGVLSLRTQSWADAATWFEKAAELDSRSYLANYHAALLVVQRGGIEAEFEKTHARLRRVIELNPAFAPAYATLATVLAANDEKLEEALAAARKAIQIEPGTLAYRLTLADVLMQMKKVDEAIALGEKTSAAAREPSDRFLAQEFLARARAYKDSLARYEAAKKEEAERLARREAERKEFEATMAKRAEAEAALRNAPALKPGESSALGTITRATCTAPEGLQIQLLLGGSTITLRAAKRAAVEYRIGAGRPLKFDPCEHLHGQQAQVIFRAAKTRTQPGELVRIEMLDNPVVIGTAVAPPKAPGDSKRAPAAGAKAAGASPAAEPLPTGRPGWSEGRISAVTCSGGELRITVDIGGGFATRLRAANYYRVEFLAASSVTLPENFQPCTQLRGRNAEVKYVAVDGKPWEGEILSVEIRP